MTDEKYSIEVEFEHIASDRIQLIEQAIAFVRLFQKEDSSIQSEPTGLDLKAYNEAVRLLEREFKRGPSLAETVVAKESRNQDS